MDISEEVRALINEEEEILSSVREALLSQIAHGRGRLQVESERARDLTSSIVSTWRDDEKHQLASDEAVAHSLRDFKRDELKTLDKLLEKPYFARIVVEELRNGTPQQIDYRIGLSSNSECRIIDWKKAPIAKLYYEYKEGDEYFEEIQGREREGTIVLRNQLSIEKGELVGLSCRFGDFALEDGEWKQATSRKRSSASSRGHLPSILSLITAEQFKAITEDAESAILIRGIAGSGKTAVALHRLAWLLDSANSDITSDKALVLVQSLALKSYIQSSLKALSVDGVEVLNLNEWTTRTVVMALGGKSISRRPRDTEPPGVRRLKHSVAFLKSVEEFLAANSSTDEEAPGTYEVLLNVLSDYRLIMSHDETGLLDRELVEAARRRTEENKRNGTLDYSDDAALVRIFQLQNGGVVLKNKALGKYSHIVCDEIQDFSAMELASVIGSAKSARRLTLVGDTAQALGEESSFPGWEKLRKFWSLGDELSRFVSLDVSHRSTLPIVRLANYVGGRKGAKAGRKGRVPIWFICSNEEDGVAQAIQWVSIALDKFPESITAIICRNEEDAKFAVSVLQPTFGSAVRLGSRDSFSFEQGVLVTEVSQSRGLEFPNVLVWNPSKFSYPNNARGRNMLYVALSRAEENVCMVSWNAPSKWLPHKYSKLVRVVDRREEEEEERREKARERARERESRYE